MLKLPFVVPPYPDEILGSWIARIKLHNGATAWHALLHEAKFEHYQRFLSFDIPNYSPALRELLAALGEKDYERLLLEHTTLPYWISFDAAPANKGLLPGTDTLPLVLGAGRRVIANLRQLGAQHLERLRARYCPTCLSRDLIKVGEPYWHRIHQLPNLSFCPEHWTRLLSGCPNCGRTNSLDADHEITPPRMKCSCGHHLNSAGTVIRPSRLQQRHTRIARAALSSGRPLCNQSQVQAFLAARIAPKELRRIIEETFGNSVTGQAGLLGDDIADNLSRWRCRTRWLSKFRAPHVCAVLASLAIDFQTAMQEASKLPREPVEKSVATLVKAARAFMLNHKAVYPERYASEGCGSHYWVLRLHDPHWLARLYPGAYSLPIPSTAQDRAYIRRFLKREFSSRRERTYRWRRLFNSNAGCRARIRDKQWFDKQHAKFHRLADKFPLSYPTTKLVNGMPCPLTSEKHLAALKDAFQAALLDKTKARPGGLSVLELAQRANLAPWTVNLLLTDNRQFRHEIRLARAELPRRRLIWAAEELVARGYPLGYTSLIAYAGCGHSKEVSVLATEIIKSIRLQQM
jgi:hypothetical protein